MNASECPDDSTVWYNPEFGERTAGELRSTLVGALDADEDTALRRWVFFTLYQPTRWPWPTGPINVGGKELAASVFSQDQFLPLYTSSGMYEGLDVNDPCALKAVEESVLKKVKQLRGLTS